MLHYQRMRLCLLSLLGLILAACGLSMNPDLPSTEERGGSPVLGGDGDGGISIGDGDVTGPGGEAPPLEGAGGASQTCMNLGGAGGEPSCEDAR